MDVNTIRTRVMAAWAFTSVFDKKGDTKPNQTSGYGDLDLLCSISLWRCLGAHLLLKPISALTEERTAAPSFYLLTAPAAGNLPAVPSNEFCQSLSHAQPAMC